MFRLTFTMKLLAFVFVEQCKSFLCSLFIKSFFIFLGGMLYIGNIRLKGFENEKRHNKKVFKERK